MIDFQTNEAANKSFSTIIKVENLIHEGMEKSAIGDEKLDENKENIPVNLQKNNRPPSSSGSRKQSASQDKIPQEKSLKLMEMRRQKKMSKSRPKFRSKS